MIPENVPMPYGWGEESEITIRNQYYDEAQKKYVESPARRGFPNPKRKVVNRPMGLVARKWGIEGAKIGHERVEVFETEYEAKRDAQALVAMMRTKRVNGTNRFEGVLKVKRTGKIVQIWLVSDK
jgi:hypothetical protein